LVILKVTVPTVKDFGETLTLVSVPLTETVVAATLVAEGAVVAANAVATPAAPTTRSNKARRTRRTGPPLKDRYST
jgi:hypothetical protein